MNVTDQSHMVQNIKKWFYNHYTQPRNEYIKFTHKWSARSTFYQLNREEILALAIETSDLEPGAPAFLGALQDATTTLWKNTTKADKDDYVHAAKEWSEKSPPPHIQSRYIGESIHFIMPSYHCLKQDGNFHAQADHPRLSEATI